MQVMACDYCIFRFKVEGFEGFVDFVGFVDIDGTTVHAHAEKLCMEPRVTDVFDRPHLRKRVVPARPERFEVQRNHSHFSHSRTSNSYPHEGHVTCAFLLV